MQKILYFNSFALLEKYYNKIVFHYNSPLLSAYKSTINSRLSTDYFYFNTFRRRQQVIV